MEGKSFCWFHEEGIEKERTLARYKGGKASSRSASLEDILAYAESVQSDPEALQAILKGVLVGHLRGEVKRSTVTGTAYACREIARLYESHQLVERLKRIEERLGIEEDRK